MPTRTIAITIGDPAGIGPEITLKTLRRISIPPSSGIIVVGSRETLASIEPETLQHPPPAVAFIAPEGPDEPFAPGRPTPASARAALAAIDRAIALVEGGGADALVTCPVSKEAITRSGFPFTGHTEYLARRAGVKSPIMMFASDRLKVALVTTHLPLRKVPAAVTMETVLAAIIRTADALRDCWEIVHPRIALCGLNPHAGEGGLLGREDLDAIAPAARAATAKGIACSGPFSADTLFRRAIDGEFDAVVAMYHDQALAVVKTCAPHAVNVTLGLPYARTSVDHGTAFDIAGKGTADEGSLVDAIHLAVRLTEKRGQRLIP